MGWLTEIHPQRRGGGWIGEMTDLNFSSPKTWAASVPLVRPVVVTGQTGPALGFTRGTGQTGVAQSTCKKLQAPLDF
jgi:hypothetical protein